MAARGAAPTTIHGRAADASLPRSTEHEPEEGQDQDDDDDEAAAVRAATVDPPLPLFPEFAVGGHCVSCR